MRLCRLASALLLFGSATARADTLQTVYVDATFQDDIVVGTLTYDLDDHFIMGGDVTSTGLYNVNWTGATSIPNSHGTSFIYVFNSAPGAFTPVGPEFTVQYAGDGLPVPFEPITICSLTNPCANFASAIFNRYVYSEIGTDIATSGYITPIAPTPEPSSFALFATGLFGFALSLRKRSSKALPDLSKAPLRLRHCCLCHTV